MAHQEHCQEVLDYLLAHPEKHNQLCWVMPLGTPGSDRAPQQPDDYDLCHTQACVAGTAALFSGRYDFKIIPVDGGRGRRYYTYHETYDGLTSDQQEDRDEDWNADNWFISVGAQYLGLDPDQAYNLFYSADREEAVLKLKEYANGEC